METLWQKHLFGRKCDVLGLGISNLPLIEYLLSEGAKVTVHDKRRYDELPTDLKTNLQKSGIEYFGGEGYLDRLDGEILFRSPGIRPDLPELNLAVRNGAILSSEMELFFALCPATILGITGSDGKTTTTTVTGLILKEVCKRRGYGKVFVGGNIGEPLLPHLREMTEQDFAVVELSSFQLQTMKRSPNRSAITNVTPNHLNWHTGMDEYIAAKANVYQHPNNSLLVTNRENEITAKIGETYSGKVVWFSSKKDSAASFEAKRGDSFLFRKNGKILFSDGKNEQTILSEEEISLPGLHNVENYMTAIGLTYGIANAEDVKKVATSFRGVKHRLETVRVFDGVTYINSSIDSSPTRTAAALSALKKKPIVICGGYDKNIPFAPLAEALCKSAKAVVLTGATMEKIKKALDDCPAFCEKTLPVTQVRDFREAVVAAAKMAESGDTVLLSPACASFDAFKNFEERGDTFRQIVESL